jgi:hypothetical protein
MLPEMLARILSQVLVEEYREHDDWLALMMACHHATNGFGREEFIEWSQSNPPYHGDDRIGERWDILRTDHNNLITKACLFAELYQHGGHEHRVLSRRGLRASRGRWPLVSHHRPHIGPGRSAAVPLADPGRVRGNLDVLRQSGEFRDEP